SPRPPACRSAPRSATPTGVATGCASVSKTSHDLSGGALRAGGDHAADPPPAALPPGRRDPRARAGEARGRAAGDPRRRLVVPRPLPRTAGDAGGPDD